MEYKVADLKGQPVSWSTICMKCIRFSFFFFLWHLNVPTGDEYDF